MNEIIPIEVLKDHDFYEIIGKEVEVWSRPKHLFRCKKCNIMLVFDIESYSSCVLNNTFFKDMENEAEYIICKQNWFYDSSSQDLSWEECYKLQQYSCDEMIVKNIIE